MSVWALGLLLVGLTQRDGPVVVLRWDAPAECPSEQDLQGRLRSRLERLSTPFAEPLEVDARITRRGGKFHTELRLRRSDGERIQTLVTDTCETAAEAAALMITVAAEDPAPLGSPTPSPTEPPPPAPPTPVPASPIDPPRPEHQSALPADPPRSTPEPPSPTSRSPRRAMVKDAPSPTSSSPRSASSQGEPPPESASPASPGRGLRGAARLAAGLELGSLFGVGPGFEASFALLWPRARIDLGVQGWLPRRRTLGDATARLSLVSAVVRGCYVPRARNFEFPACGGAELGAMIGTADGVDNAATVPLPWAAGTLGIALLWRPSSPGWSRLSLFVGPTMAVAWTRPRFEIERIGRVHRTGSVGGRFAAGTEVRF